MTLTVLNVAYPFAPVGPDAVGGAEQVLTQIDAALVSSGHNSIIIACEGSRTAGRLLAVPRVEGTIGTAQMQAAHARHRAMIAAALRDWPIDVVHLHGADFTAYAPWGSALARSASQGSVPVLATLHLPSDAYFSNPFARDDIWINCVSQSQHARCPPYLRLLPPVENGVSASFFDACFRKRDFVLMLTRVCPEKGIHLGIEAAKRAGAALLIAGQVFPFDSHLRYFEQEVRPRLDRRRRFIGPAGTRRKRRLLASARALLVPSLTEETSSLVAREALASGTPVIAFARGALTETVEHGRTGFLVHDENEMAKAIGPAAHLDPRECREAAQARFSLQHMVEGYFALYRRLRAHGRNAAMQGAA